MSFLKFLPAPHTYLQNFAAAHHWSFFLFSISYSGHYLYFQNLWVQTSSKPATTSGLLHPGTLLFVHLNLATIQVIFQNPDVDENFLLCKFLPSLLHMDHM